MKVVLIPCGPTNWSAQGRLLGRVELSLSDAGRERLGDWAAQLKPHGLARIMHAPDELSTHTAKMLAGKLDVATRAASELHEVDIGLWAGLTESELKARYAKAHRQLVESPLSVSPPGGEELKTAAERVSTALRKRLKRNGKETVGFVMRPFSLALARCALGELEPKQLWAAQQTNDPVVIEPAAAPATTDKTAEPGA